MTSVTEGAKGRQSPGFFTYSNKRWRLPLFLFFCDESQLTNTTLRLKFWRLNALIRSDGGIVGLAKRLLRFPTQRVVGSPEHSEAAPVIKRRAASLAPTFASLIT
jgi:hypothetical protein